MSSRLGLSIACLGAAVCIVAGGALATADPAGEAAVRVFARVEPGEVLIGDRFRYEVEVDAAAGTEVMVPVLGGAIGLFTIVDFGDEPPRVENGRVRMLRWYSLVGFETGEPFLPAPEVRFRRDDAEWQVATGNSVSIRVHSLLDRDPDATDIRDIKPPEAVPFDWTPYAVLAALALLLGVAGWGIYWLWTRPRRAAVAPARPAHEIALEALAQLKQQGLVEAGEIAAFYVGLTHIVRVYLEDGLKLRAPEMTTEEFLAAAGSDERLDSKQRRILGEFLTQADLVKFARAVPTMRDCEAAYEAARRFIEETRPRPLTGQGEGRRAAA